MWASAAFGQSAKPSIPPLCLWEHAENDPSVEACIKRHSVDAVTFERGAYVSAIADELLPDIPDEIWATPVGTLKTGDEIFLIASRRYGEKIDGTQVVAWRKAPGGGKIDVVATSGYREQGGIAAAVLLPSEAVQVDIRFDTAWGGIDDHWTGLPKGWNDPPPLGSGCAACGLGIAHVTFPSSGNGRPVLTSIDIDRADGDSCKARQVRAMGGPAPYRFSPAQLGQLIRNLRTCPEGETLD